MSDLLVLAAPQLTQLDRCQIRDIIDGSYIITGAVAANRNKAITAYVPEFVPHLDDIVRCTFHTEVVTYQDTIPARSYAAVVGVPDVDRAHAVADPQAHPAAAWIWSNLDAAAATSMPTVVIWQMRLYAVNTAGGQMLAAAVGAEGLGREAVSSDGSVELEHLVPPF